MSAFTCAKMNDTVGKESGSGVGVGEGESAVAPSLQDEQQQQAIQASNDKNTDISPKGQGLKRKHSIIITTSAGEIDLADLPPPRPGRPSGKIPCNPAMQEARRRARILRNRAAAQHSREKKRRYLEILESENAELRSKNVELEDRMAKTEIVNADLSTKLEHLSNQLQGLQKFLLGENNGQQQQQQQQQQSPSGLQNWSSTPTPAAVSPLNALVHHPSSLSSQQQSPSVYAISPSSFTTSTRAPALSNADTTALSNKLPTTPLASSPPVPATMTANLPPAKTTITSTEHNTLTNTVPVAGIFSNVVPEISGQGLSESAALEQSGAPQIFCTAPDSQQRRPSPNSEISSRSPQHQHQHPRKRELKAAAAAESENSSSTSSLMSWEHSIQSVVKAILSVTPRSSPQALWTIFCALWWVLNQNGGWVSRHQLTRIARGILEHHQTTAVNTIGKTVAPCLSGLACLSIVAAWFGSRSRVAIALRRVVGDGPVDQVCYLVSRLRIATRSIEKKKVPGSLSRSTRYNSIYLYKKQKSQHFPP